MAVALEFSNVHFSYDRSVPIIENASFELKEDASMCVVGPNGGGKSTLVKLVLGLLTPQSGTIRVLGESPSESRATIGYVPQSLQFDPRFPITVLDVVLMGRLGSGLRLGPFGRRDKEVADKALQRVDLNGLSSCRFSKLSGGQRQRVLIARALVDEPRLLLLDEPTANVDQTFETQFQGTLRELAAEMPVVLVSHDLGFVSSWVEHVLCVNRNVHLHPTISISGKTLHEIFDHEVVAVRHDQDCPPGEHIHHRDHG
ncbi:MAG: ABC transporter ATP-binding protein [Verrucomicrobiales bacterium]|jgi:zinc transport system ATP-binding protein|nr:ABC transporter ATP-binding protein [Verrucomicrobiales bacterium]MDF1787325.1 ABC transporter ATP-binding protein [Verrucomicrobiales bacterium]